MLTLIIPEQEYFDEDKEEFFYTPSMKLNLEHSLLSIAKWESKWHKAFLGREEKTVEETLDYIRCMTIGTPPDMEALIKIPQDLIQQINAYIEDPMTATWFSNQQGGSNRVSNETITNELVYYWMIAYNIPFDPCEKWHFERLMTLIKVCQLKSEKPKKMSKRALAARNAKINAQRRARLHTKG